MPKGKKELSIKTKLWMVQNHKCAYCKNPNLKLLEVSIDHVIPKSKGGLNHYSNYLVACNKCNQAKADKLPTKEQLEILVSVQKKLGIRFPSLVQNTKIEPIKKISGWPANRAERRLQHLIDKAEYNNPFDLWAIKQGFKNYSQR